MQKCFFEKTILNPSVKDSKKVIFYGAGAIGFEAVYKSLLLYELQPDYICDSDKTKTGDTIFGIEIINPEILCEFEKNTLIVITSSFIDEIANYLKEMGFTNVFIYGVAGFWEQWFYSRICKKHSAIAEQNEHKIKQVVNVLCDNKSQEVFENLLYGRTSNKFDIFSKIYSESEYFPNDIIKLRKDEVFVDAGAYRGESTILFAQKSNYKYKKIYAFEPGSENVERFMENTKNFKNVELFPFGIYSMSGVHKLKTKGLTYDSLMISDTDGDSDVETKKLDDLLLSEKVTYIKMDIEGAELYALEGAEKIIQKDKPKLAVSAYHQVEDLWEIPLKIHNINPDYKIYLRHHSGSTHNGTICYAVS